MLLIKYVNRFFLLFKNVKFQKKGDQEREKGFAISYLMDRFTVNTAKSQIGFIDVIVQPTFEVIRSFLPLLSNYIGNFETNKERWRDKIPEYDEKLSRIFRKTFYLTIYSNKKTICFFV